MTLTISVTGKGGSGKSTFAALAVRHLHESTKEVVLAVDADPNANLGLKLGTEPGRTVGSIREDLTAAGEGPRNGMSRQEHLEYQVRLAIKEGAGFDLLTMGRPEGPGCYCYANDMLRAFLRALSERYKYVVIDHEAGLEHLSRGTTPSCDVLFVLCDRSKTSLESAKRISALASEMKLSARRRALVFNMLDPGSEGPPLNKLDGFDSVHGVRRSSSIQARTLESETLPELPPWDPAATDVARAVDAARLG